MSVPGRQVGLCVGRMFANSGEVSFHTIFADKVLKKSRKALLRRQKTAVDVQDPYIDRYLQHQSLDA